MNYNNSRLNAMIQGGQWQPNYHGEMLDTYNQQAHRSVAITILAGISSRNHYFICEERTNYKHIRKYMIAKIYPDGHPDLQGKKDPTHPVRYFDIRKLTPRECYSLMGVPPQQIDTLMRTEKKPYMAWVGVDAELAVFGLEPSATRREVDEAYEDSVRPLTEIQMTEGGEDSEEVTFEVPGADKENALMVENYSLAYEKIKAASQEQRYGDVQIISNSSHYKLAGNSIVCDVLMYIYEELLYPTGRRLPQEQTDLFAQPQFRLTRDWKKEPLRLTTLCSGYDSQAIAMDMLKERYPDFRWELKAWSEFDPESSRPLEEQPAVVAHNLLFPQYKDLNRGDMTKADWSDLADAGIDLLTYSTPCQSISQAGKREGIKKGSGTRSAVLWSTEMAVEHLRPKVLLQENVRALINSVNMPDFKEWCTLLESYGYVNFLAPSFPTPWGTDKRDKKTVPGILNAKHYGVPQNRERVYMVSVRADLLGGTQYEFPRPFPLDKCIADVLEDNVDERFFLKPDSVIKFLTVNESTGSNDIHYTVTDHKLSDEEIAKVRSGK
jgi:DNA (cytosine-5)-methyltransferase 1